MLAILSDLVKAGRVGRVEVINVAQHPELAAAAGVRSVPWLGIGPFELAGMRPRAEIETWIARASDEHGMADYFHTLLKEGELAKVLAAIASTPERLAALLPIVGNPEASLNVRLGAGAVFEDYAGSAALRALLNDLVALSAHADARVRADACHLLGLTHDIAAGDTLRARLGDPDPDVREIAGDSLETLRAQEAPGLPTA
jgi:hypothetical protein